MENRKQLIEDNIKLVYLVLHKYYPAHVHNEDVIQAGMLGLCNAADKWDESKSKFSSFATFCIRNAMRVEFRNQCKNKENLSLDHPVYDRDGNVIPFGELQIGENDVDYFDIEFYDTLTDFERKVVDLRRSGLTMTEIAKRLNSNRTTLWQTMRKIKNKWGITNED